MRSHWVGEARRGTHWIGCEIRGHGDHILGVRRNVPALRNRTRPTRSATGHELSLVPTSRTLKGTLLSKMSQQLVAIAGGHVGRPRSDWLWKCLAAIVRR